MATRKITATSTRKESALAFLEMVSSGEVRTAYDRYIAPGFRHHNPHFKGDALSLLHGMEEAHANHPRTRLEIQRAIEEGDLVAVHSRVRMDPDSPGVAVVHILRFDGDRVVEMWDVGQAVPERSQNESGMF